MSIFRAQIATSGTKNWLNLKFLLKIFSFHDYAAPTTLALSALVLLTLPTQDLEGTKESQSAK